MPFGDGVRRPCTLIFQAPEPLRTGSQSEFVEKLVTAVAGHDITAVQFVPGYHVRVTFRLESSRDTVFRDGLVIDGVDVHLTEADSTLCHVYVHHLPVEVPDDDLREALRSYGRIVSVDDVFYRDTRIRTGSRIVKMYIEDDIPSRVRVLRYPCRVWYRSQPQVCYICQKPAHVAADCPLRGLCRKCRKPGHIARDCVDSPEEPPRAADAPDASSQPEPSPTADDARSDSSEPMDADELASGDEEVLANAPPQTGSPRRTRSSTARARAVPDDSLPASQATFPPSGVVPDVSGSPSPPLTDPAPSSSADLLSPPEVLPAPMFNVIPGFLPPVFSPLAPVRTAPPEVRDAILTSHSARSMFYTEKLVPLDGSSPVFSHVVHDHGSMTCAILEDSVTFESARAEHYADCHASPTVSRLSPPVSTALPGVPRCVDLSPLPPSITPSRFTQFIYDSEDDIKALMEQLLLTIRSTELDFHSYTPDEIKSILPAGFTSLSDHDKNGFLDLICCGNFRELISTQLRDDESDSDEDYPDD